MGIVYSGEYAFSRVPHYFLSAFATRMFSALLRDTAYFSSGSGYENVSIETL
jgi:hypothetical protein